MRHSFGSDNHSGIAPEILEAIVEENSNFALPYGEDGRTKEVEQLFKSLFGEETESFLLFSGTATNSLILKALTQSYHSILTAETAHINVDECGAPEWFTGCKVIPLKERDGKLSPEVVKEALHSFGDQHRSQPKVLSISQPTELGTVYTVEEIKELAEMIHAVDGYLHMDGARIANAAARLELPLKAFTTDAGVDALSFGGTKSGLLLGEAALFLNQKLAENFKYIRKQGGQLFSKSRFLAAQFRAFLSNDLYHKYCRVSNELATYFAERLATFKEITITRPVESNALFFSAKKPIVEKLRENHYFYEWNSELNEHRLLCSFNSTKQDIDNFITDLEKIIDQQ